VTTPRASIVIPAHDEAASIEGTLRSVLAEADDGEFEVVVVCNGCQDDTAARARRVAGVEVVEIPTPSKIAALNAGDDRARTFPRIYLDADTGLTTAAARALVAAVSRPDVRVAGMRADLDLDGATRPARWFHEFRERLPVFSDGIIGAGVYALDRVARARFPAWPDVLGDDQFVLRSFPPSERAFVREHRTRTAAAGDLRTIVRRGVRVRRGNAELTSIQRLGAPAAGIATALKACAADPRRWPGAATWLLASLVIRFRARAGGVGDWGSSVGRRGVAGGDR
jgi:glycosyltransferase involved in cell wall biosynthesis